MRGKDPNLVDTTRTRLTAPLNGWLYVTSRPKVALEMPIPLIGETMAHHLGQDFQTSYIIAVTDGPSKDAAVITITHADIPSEADQLASNWERSIITVGGVNYPCINRSVIIKASDYKVASPLIGSAMPIATDGMFNSDGYTLLYREVVKSGINLEPVFRVEKRTYIIATAVVAQQAYAEREAARTTQTLVSEDAAADTGLTTLESKVDQLGNGLGIKTTLDVLGWHELKGSTWDEDLQTQVTRRELPVTPPTSFADPFTSYQIVNKDRFLRIVEDVPEAALAARHHVFPTTDVVSLPAVLTGVKCVVTRNRSNGNSVSGGTQFSVMNESSMAIAADFIYDIVQGGQFGCDAEVHIFYLKTASRGSVLDRTNSIPWPLYREKSHRVSVRCAPRSQHVTYSSSQGGQSLSEGSQVGASVTTQMMPASLHAPLAIEIVYEDHDVPKGLADAIVANIESIGAKQLAIVRQAVSGGRVVMGIDCSVSGNAALVNNYLDLMDNQNALATDLQFSDFPVTVEPRSLPATNVPDIIPGRYLKNCNISPYKYGWVQVEAKVIIVANP